MGDVVGSDVPRAAVGRVETGELVAGLNGFGLDYLRLLTEGSPDENVVFSPLSIGMAFGMAKAGARGETAAQIADVFGFLDRPGAAQGVQGDQRLADSGKSTVRLANRIYPRLDFELVEEFVATLRPSTARRSSDSTSSASRRRHASGSTPGCRNAPRSGPRASRTRVHRRHYRPRPRQRALPRGEVVAALRQVSDGRAPFTTLDGSTDRPD